MRPPGFYPLVLLAAGLCLQLAPLTSGQGLATDWPPISATATSSAPGLPASHVCDGDAGTAWSSATHATAFNSEALVLWMDATHPVNYIKIYPLTLGGSLKGHR